MALQVAQDLGGGDARGFVNGCSQVSHGIPIALRCTSLVPKTPSMIFLGVILRKRAAGDMSPGGSGGGCKVVGGWWLVVGGFQKFWPSCDGSGRQ